MPEKKRPNFGASPYGAPVKIAYASSTEISFSGVTDRVACAANSWSTLAALATGASKASDDAQTAHTSFDMVMLLDSNENAPRASAVDHRVNQESFGGARERNARRGAAQTAASECCSRATGAGSGNATAGMEAPTALDSCAQAKHLSHVVLPGVDSCLCPVACARSCIATACWPTTTAKDIRNAKRIRRARII